MTLTTLIARAEWIALEILESCPALRRALPRVYATLDDRECMRVLGMTRVECDIARRLLGSEVR